MQKFVRGLYRSAGPFAHGEVAQDAFEYVLIIGVVVVSVLIAITTPVGTTIINAVINGTCSAVDGLTYVSLSCPLV